MNSELSIGITTTKFRTKLAYRLLQQIKRQAPDIRVNIVINTHDTSEQARVEAIKAMADNVKLTDDLMSLCWCRNQLAMIDSDIPYILWFDDDAYLTTATSIYDIVKDYRQRGVDVFGAYNNNCSILMFKGDLAKILWWDERYFFPWEDCDFHMRLAKHKITFSRCENDIYVGHAHSEIEHYGNIGKYNGPEIHKIKWGLSKAEPAVGEPYPPPQLLEDIDLYPEYTQKFLAMERSYARG